jgi:hypothetical protein
MTTRTISTLPHELVDIVFRLGNRKLILLEGEDDVEVIEEWFSEYLRDLLFYAVEGHLNVETYLETILKLSSRKEVYGIIDRDFRTDKEVAECNKQLNTHLFILWRYAIENYLLEPLAVWDELKTYHGRNFADTVEMISNELMNICSQLKTIMAVNWVIKESNTDANYFKKGHTISDRDEIIRQASRRLHYDITTTEKKVRTKEELIESKLGILEDAYTCINGKHIFHQIYEKYVNSIKRGLRKDHFRNLLTRNVKEKTGIHNDLKIIVRERILKE